VKHRGILQGKH